MKEIVSSTSFCTFVESAHQNQFYIGSSSFFFFFFPPAIATCYYDMTLSLSVLHVDLVKNDCYSLGCCPHN